MSEVDRKHETSIALKELTVIAKQRGLNQSSLLSSIVDYCKKNPDFFTVIDGVVNFKK